MKSWLERIAEAEQRQRRWWNLPWRFLGAFRPTFCWPFTSDDLRCWQALSLCPAGELCHRYGLYPWDARSLYRLGLDFGTALMRGNVRRARAIYVAMEDHALELKRGAEMGEKA